MQELDSPLAARGVATPSHGERKTPLDAIVLHYTGMASSAAALLRLCDPASEVSCHYFVKEDGAVLQLVPESRRAWHAGRSLWAGESDMNSRSIGIEIVNPGHDGGLPPYPEAQIEAVIALCRDIAARHAIVPQRVLAHSDIAPGRKRDPGEMFPWQQLHKAGVGHWARPHRPGDAVPAADEGEARAMLGRYGYGAGPSLAAVVGAFQRHFRPARVDGVADWSTLATLRDLIAALP